MQKTTARAIVSLAPSHSWAVAPSRSPLSGARLHIGRDLRAELQVVVVRRARVEALVGRRVDVVLRRRRRRDRAGVDARLRARACTAPPTSCRDRTARCRTRCGSSRRGAARHREVGRDALRCAAANEQPADLRRDLRLVLAAFVARVPSSRAAPRRTRPSPCSSCTVRDVVEVHRLPARRLERQRDVQLAVRRRPLRRFFLLPLLIWTSMPSGSFTWKLRKSLPL